MTKKKTEIKSMDEIYAFHNTTKEAFEKFCEGLTSDEIGYREEKMIVAYYNDGKLPDFCDGTPKYHPCFQLGSSSGPVFSCNVCDYWCTGSGVGARQVFHGKDAYDNMIDAVTKFLPQFEKSRT
jgi:hypothetical protein